MTRLTISLIVLLAGLAGCVDRSVVETVPAALTIGTAKTVFAATTRENGTGGDFGPGRSEMLSLLELTVSIPPEHQTGRIEYGYTNPDPRTQFALAGSREFASPSEFRTHVNQAVTRRPAGDREATLYVHGFNTTQTEAAFRAAQLAHDLDLPGVQMIYSWPSLGSPLGYAYDGDSMLFARDGLEKLLRDIHRSGTERIVIVAHSMGSVLVMEALRQIEIADPGWSSRFLNGIVLISPDLDVDLFRTQMSRIAKPPQPFIVFVSRKDKLLTLSQRLRGTHSRERLGNISSVEAISDLPIDIIDTTEFSDDAQSSHFVAGSSPTLIKMLNEATKMAQFVGHDRITPESLLPGAVAHYSAATEITPYNLAGER
ncbi:alpha/beta fold hydrolase [Rhodobacteraceae bacterium M382]|nr:alpha/beta fold hydrolase [Rhodobacteraceae bacterium M382]